MEQTKEQEKKQRSIKQVTTLEQKRREKNLTQNEVAKLINVSGSTYSRYEHTRCAIPSMTAFALREIFESVIDELFNPASYFVNCEQSGEYGKKKNKQVGVLEKKRRELKLSQHNVAKMLGISAATYSAYESNHYSIPAPAALAILELFKCDASELFVPASYYVRNLRERKENT